MSQAAKAQEPSMEEILASIRRIIADDDESKTSGTEPSEMNASEAAAGRPAGAAALAAELRRVVAEPRAATPRPPMPSAPSRTAAAPAAPSTHHAAAAPPPAAKRAVASRDDIESVLADLDEGAAEIMSDPLSTASSLHDSGAASMSVPAPDNDVLELTEAMARSSTKPSAPASFRTVQPTDDIEFAETAPPPQGEAMHQLMSNATLAAVDSAFNSLAGTVLAGNARTLDDIVREMLRPMLKSWLDDNLPGLVERMVRAEIERVSRGR